MAAAKCRPILHHCAFMFFWTSGIIDCMFFVCCLQLTMHSSTNLKSSPTFAEIHCSCNKVYYKQELHILLCILGQIVAWQYIPKPLDSNWPCTVINDHEWLLWNCLLIIENEKSPGSIACMRKITASVLLKVFINSNKRCKQHTIHDSRGPDNITTQSRSNEWNEESVI